MASLADVSKPGVIEVAPMPGATFFKGLELPGAVLTSTGACVVAAGRQHGMAVQHSCAGHWLPSDLYELIGTHTAGPALIRRGAQLSQEPNFSLTRRRQELLEMALSYAISNCADLAQAMAYEGPENEQLVICGSRISAAPTEEEFGDLLGVVTDVDDIETLPE